MVQFGSPSFGQGAGLDMRDFDKSIDPRADFDGFVNGGWKKNTAIPPEESGWEAFQEMQERNFKILKKIMEDAAADATAAEGSERRKLGDFWASGMDEARINASGGKPLQPIFARIDKINNVESLQSEIAKLHTEMVFPIFAIQGDQDFKDATRIILNMYQGGIGLPDRDYYTRTDDESKSLREKYVAHVAQMFQLIGVDAKKAAADAATVLKIETALAEASLTNVEQRDPNKIYHLMKTSEAQALSPNFNWSRYLTSLGLSNINELNIGMPDFLKKVNELLTSVSLDDWKVYLKWHVVHGAARALSLDFVNANFEFYGKTLQGSKELRPRWKRMLAFTDAALGEALSREFVGRAFSPRAKARAAEMVNYLIEVFAERIKTRPWMSEETKKEALVKLRAIAPKIGYPDKFRDYTTLKISKNASLYENLAAASAFEFQRNINKIGKPVDLTEWGMLAHEVNAYYNPTKNEIAFPAGILQAPFFDESQDDALNYGAIGSFIGHELTHGFDDEGSQFDAKGNLRMWWTKNDREEFERRAALVEKQFNEFVAIEDKKVNGKLTLGENIADLGGLTIAYHAYQRSLAGKPAPAPLDGFTGEQRFFISWARGWRALTRPEALKLMVQTNPHSPPRFRILGPLQNMQEFAKAFNCKPGDAMARDASARAEIW